jgi:mannose-6-phosphate isomerase-like protein (cupin superfamily)
MIVSNLKSLEETLPPLHHDMVSNEIFTKDQAIHARVAISILGPGGGAEMHVHPGSEHYFLMLEGKLKVKTDKEEVIVGPGECVLVEDGEPHQVINAHDGIKKNQGNITKVSEELGIPRRTLYRRIDKYGIDIDKYRQES